MKQIKKRISYQFFSKSTYLSYKLVFLYILINLVLMFLIGHVVIRVFFFLICAGLLYKFGSLPFADLDPVPFFTGLLLLWYDLPNAIQFMVWTIPVADVLSSRFNQFSFVNAIALFMSLLVVSFVPFSLSLSMLLIILMILFNCLRYIIYMFMGLGIQAILAPMTHVILYSSIILVLSSLLNKTIFLVALLP